MHTHTFTVYTCMHTHRHIYMHTHTMIHPGPYSYIHTVMTLNIFQNNVTSIKKSKGLNRLRKLVRQSLNQWITVSVTGQNSDTWLPIVLEIYYCVLATTLLPFLSRSITRTQHATCTLSLSLSCLLLQCWNWSNKQTKTVFLTNCLFLFAVLADLNW